MLVTDAYAQTSCSEHFKDLHSLEKIDTGANDKELLSVYGFNIEVSQTTPAAIVLNNLSESRHIKSRFGHVNELSVVCSSEKAVVFVIDGKLGKLLAFYLFNKGLYYAAPLLYTEGEVVVIKSDSSVK